MPIPEFSVSASDDDLDLFAATHPTLRIEQEQLRELLGKLPAMEQAERAMYRPAEEIIGDFRDRVRAVYEYPPLSREEIEREFTAEKLSSLSLQEYIELLRGVPARFVTHITRHGFRDRTSHHNSGDLNFQRGFEELLKKRQLQSALDQINEGEWNEQRVRAVLERIGIPQKLGTKGEALERLSQFLDLAKNPWIKSEFADNNAFHGAIDYVADWYYGGEIGNQIFVVYPAAFIASHYECSHQASRIPDGFLEKNPDHDKNDLWMMRKDDKRGVLPLDAGIVFIPSHAQVDPTTGSRYAIKEESFQTEEKQLAEHTISSHDYWEEYFRKIGYKPSKIIYYDQMDPNEALAEFREKARLPNHLHSTVDLKSMFAENMLSQTAMKENLTPQRSLFRDLARTYIDRCYPA